MAARAVSIADLKNNLSAHLARVREGEEILVRDRRTPIAKIVPLTAADLLPEEAALAAEGKIRLPRKPLPASFWKARAPRVPADRALELLREERDAR
jgi:prevent-host-death family protein